MFCRSLFSDSGSIELIHGSERLASFEYKNRGRSSEDYRLTQPLAATNFSFENEHLKLIWAAENLRITSEIKAALEDSNDPYAFHLLATNVAAGTRVLDLELGNPKRLDSPDLDRAAQLGYPPSMVLKARILVQEQKLETSAAFQAADPYVLEEIRFLLIGAVASGYFSALLLHEELLSIGFDLTEADVLARAQREQDQRTKSAIRMAMITILQDACKSAELNIMSNMSKGLITGVVISDGCRVQTSLGFFADLSFSGVRLLGCSGETCRFETINQCYARGAMVWETCGNHIDTPWSGNYRISNNGVVSDVMRLR